MNWTPWLRERRMKTFKDVPERLETPQRCRGWRWRHRHEEEGLGGLFDRKGSGGPDRGEARNVSHPLHGLDREAFPRASAGS